MAHALAQTACGDLITIAAEQLAEQMKGADAVVLAAGASEEGNSVADAVGLPQDRRCDGGSNDRGHAPIFARFRLPRCVKRSTHAGGVRHYVKVKRQADGPVTLVQEIAVEYGHFEDYIDWLSSAWKPTMEATKKAGIIIDY